MKRKILFVVFFVILILFFTLSISLIYLRGFDITELLTNRNNKVLYIQEMPVSFIITDERIIGINIDTDDLKYGTIMKGNVVGKKITIINPFNENINVNISFSKNIAEFMRPDFYNFNLYGINDSLKFSVGLITENAELGSYNGTMRVVITRM